MANYVKISWGLHESYTLTFLYFSFYLSIYFLWSPPWPFPTQPPFTHSFNKYLLSSCYFPSPILGTRDTEVGKTVPSASAVWSLPSLPTPSLAQLSVGFWFLSSRDALLSAPCLLALPSLPETLTNGERVVMASRQREVLL